VEFVAGIVGVWLGIVLVALFLQRMFAAEKAAFDAAAAAAAAADDEAEAALSDPTSEASTVPPGLPADARR